MRGVTRYTACLLVILSMTMFSQTPPTRQVDYIDVNNIRMWFSMDGMTAHNPTTDGPGLEYPKGSGKHVIFTEGLLWGGMVNGELRMGGSTYRYGLQPGKILSSGDADNTDDPKYRIYKVRMLTSSAYQQLPQTDKDRLRADYEEWPFADGAPWVDVDNNQLYEPDFDAWIQGDRSADYPKFKGDEVLWWVSNDLDSRRTNYLYGTPPVGLEVQTTVWAYDDPGTLGNTVYMKYRLINRNWTGSAFEDIYLAKWVYPEVGNGLDDFVGLDTVCNMAYAYNGEDSDSVYLTQPPAVGHVLVQGPITPDTSSVALFDNAERRDYRNSTISGFAYYVNGDNVYAAPAIGSSFGAIMLYRYMQCSSWNGQSYVDPTTGLVVCPPLAGNPVTQQGWIDGILHPPGSRQYLLSSGPFDMFPGDTQEVVFAVTVAQGNNNLHSVELLLQQACELQSLYPQQVVVSAPAVASHPQTLEVSAAYPNPVSGKATIAYRLPAIENVTLTLTNVLGQHVRKYDLGRKQNGLHNWEIPTNDLPSGMYLLTLRTGTHFNTQRILVR